MIIIRIFHFHIMIDEILENSFHLPLIQVSRHSGSSHFITAMATTIVTTTLVIINYNIYKLCLKRTI